MSLFGAVGAMQKSLRDNKALRKDKKSLSEITKDYHEKPGFFIQDKKMSHSEFEKFKSELVLRKKKEKYQRLILLGSIVLLGLLTLILMHIF